MPNFWPETKVSRNWAILAANLEYKLLIGVIFLDLTYHQWEDERTGNVNRTNIKNQTVATRIVGKFCKETCSQSALDDPVWLIANTDYW